MMVDEDGGNVARTSGGKDVGQMARRGEESCGTRQAAAKCMSCLSPSCMLSIDAS